MTWVAAGVASATATISAVGMITGSKAKKKARAAQEALTREALQLQRDMAAKFDVLIGDLPQETAASLKLMTGAYAQLTQMMNEAKASSDEKSVAMFAAQRDMVDSQLATELSLIGADYSQFIAVADELSARATAMLEADDKFNAQFKEEYLKQTEGGMDNLQKIADASGKRIDDLIKSEGLPEGSAAVLSNMQQQVSDVKRSTEQFEAARGKGGTG